ncbi:MAG TPA: membrane dipeptidase, partial [Acidobacteriota bacterium]|nr:membrane dipeptidase [Acidobacteriota bacterium]
MKNLRIVPLVMAGVLLSCSAAEHGELSLHQSALVADMHSDTALRMLRGFDFSQRDSTGHMDIPRLREGGIDLQAFACWVSTDMPPDECLPRIELMIDSLDSQIARNPDKIGLCRTASEALDLIDAGKIAALLAIENGVAIAGDLDNLQHFYDRGVRILTLTHTASSDWCISSADTMPAFPGLTDFGRSVVQKMNALGMIVDVSHASPEAVAEVLRITSDPIIASHSCVRALCDHDRNLTDDQIRTIAANGGVIGINFYNGYLADEWNERTDAAYDARRAEIDSLSELYKDDDTKRREAMWEIRRAVRAELANVRVDVGTVVDHIDYIVRVVGPDYVGLGSDFDGVGSLPD